VAIFLSLSRTCRLRFPLSGGVGVFRSRPDVESMRLGKLLATTLVTQQGASFLNSYALSGHPYERVCGGYCGGGVYFIPCRQARGAQVSKLPGAASTRQTAVGVLKFTKNPILCHGLNRHQIFVLFPISSQLYHLGVPCG
jgi:hypothetical protein